MEESILDDIISLLLDSLCRVRSRHVVVNVQLFEYEALQLSRVSRDIFLREPSLLHLKAPIKIAGDIHGQYNTLLKLFEHGGLPPQSNYLFLGNYVDFGKQRLETIWLLLAFKIKYPKNIFLLRGNHECTSTNSVYGFREECMRRFNSELWNVYNECFNCLPIAALVDDRIMCVHGGLSPSLQDLDQIRNIQRPIDDPFECLISDLLWSNPSRDVHGWGKNDRPRGRVSYTFGADKVKEFLEEHDLDLICRGHQVVEEGYEFFADEQLVTIFSATNQRAPNGREFYNVGALMSVDENLMCSLLELILKWSPVTFPGKIPVGSGQ